MISVFTTSIQHSVGSPSHSDQTRKRNKRHQIGKEEAKLSLFANYMVIYIENTIESTKNLPDVISEFDKIVSTKSIFRNLRHFLHQQWNFSKWNQKKNSIWYSNKKNKVPRNKCNQGGKKPVLRKLHNTEERN